MKRGRVSWWKRGSAPRDPLSKLIHSCREVSDSVLDCSSLPTQALERIGRLLADAAYLDDEATRVAKLVLRGRRVVAELGRGSELEILLDGRGSDFVLYYAVMDELDRKTHVIDSALRLAEGRLELEKGSLSLITEDYLATHLSSFPKEVGVVLYGGGELLPKLVLYTDVYVAPFREYRDPRGAGLVIEFLTSEEIADQLVRDLLERFSWSGIDVARSLVSETRRLLTALDREPVIVRLLEGFAGGSPGSFSLVAELSLDKNGASPLWTLDSVLRALESGGLYLILVLHDESRRRAATSIPLKRFSLDALLGGAEERWGEETGSGVGKAIRGKQLA